MENKDFQQLKKREFKILTKQLKTRNMYLEKKLFKAVFKSILLTESEVRSKEKATSFQAKKNGVKKKDIDMVLKDIDYLSPTQRRMAHNKTAVSESRQFDEVLQHKK